MTKIHDVSVLLLVLGVCEAIAFGVALSIIADADVAKTLRVGAGIFLFGSVVFAFLASFSAFKGNVRNAGIKTVDQVAEHILSERDFAREAQAAIAATSATGKQCAILVFDIARTRDAAPDAQSVVQRLSQWCDVLTKLEVALRAVDGVATVEGQKMSVLVPSQGRSGSLDAEIAVLTGILSGSTDAFVEKSCVIYEGMRPKRPQLVWQGAYLSPAA